MLVSAEGIITLQKSLFSHTFLCNSIFFVVAKEWRHLRQKKYYDVSKLFLLIMLVVLLQDNVIFGRLKSLHITCFSRFVLFFET